MCVKASKDSRYSTFYWSRSMKPICAAIGVKVPSHSLGKRMRCTRHHIDIRLSLSRRLIEDQRHHRRFRPFLRVSLFLSRCWLPVFEEVVCFIDHCIITSTS